MYSQQPSKQQTKHRRHQPAPGKRLGRLFAFLLPTLLVLAAVLIPAAFAPARAGASARLNGMALWDIVPDESTLFWSPWPALGLAENLVTVGATYDNDVWFTAGNGVEVGRVVPVQIGTHGGWLALRGEPHLLNVRSQTGSGAIVSREFDGSFSESLGLVYGPGYGFSFSVEAMPFSVDGGAAWGQTWLAGPGFAYRPDATALVSGRVMGASYRDTEGYSRRGIQARGLAQKRLPGGTMLSGAAAFDLWNNRVPGSGNEEAVVVSHDLTVTGGASKIFGGRVLAGAGVTLKSEVVARADKPEPEKSLSLFANGGAEIRLTPNVFVRGGVSYPVVAASGRYLWPMFNAGVGYAAGSWRFDAAAQDLAGMIKAGTRNISFSVSKAF